MGGRAERADRDAVQTASDRLGRLQLREDRAEGQLRSLQQERQRQVKAARGSEQSLERERVREREEAWNRLRSLETEREREREAFGKRERSLERERQKEREEACIQLWKLEREREREIEKAQLRAKKLQKEREKERLSAWKRFMNLERVREKEMDSAHNLLFSLPSMDMAIMSCQEVVDLLKDRASNSSNQTEDVKVIDWEEYQDALARLCGLSTVFTKYRVRREALSEQVESALQARTKVLEQVDAVEGMRDRLSNKRQELEKAVASLHETSRNLIKATEKLWPPAQVFFTSAESLVSARGRLEDAEKLLAGEGGNGRLLHLRSLLEGRRRTMISQVGALYPLAACTSPSSLSSGKSISAAQTSGQPHGKSGEGLKLAADSTCTAGPENASIAIAGLQLLAPLKKKPGLFDEKYDYEVSATALGYVAHVVSLVAAYLDVPLRYPLRLRASRSYIQDPAPPFDFTTADIGPIVAPPAPESGSRLPVEFPLFSEGQELTRSAYAVFLLNKDLEQLLNGLGVEAVGPRHTLPNLNRLLTTLLCDRTVEAGRSV